MSMSGDFDEPTVEEIKRKMIDLRTQLDRERRLRMMLEEQTRQLESQLYPERLRHLASQVQAQMKYQEEKQVRIAIITNCHIYCISYQLSDIILYTLYL